MTPLVRINAERRILVEVSRTRTKVRCITPERDVRLLPLVYTEWYGSGPNKVARERRFDEEWLPLTSSSGEPYPVERCLFRWLELDNNRTAPLTERARKEITMLIVTKNNKLVGKFADSELCNGVDKLGFVSGSIQELAENFSGSELAVLYMNVTGKTVSGGRVKNKQKAAEEIWAAVEAIQQAAPEAAKKAVKEKEVRQLKKYEIVPGADFSNRRGGYRATLNAIAAGAQTAKEIHDHVCKHFKVDYKPEDIYADLTVGRKHGYVREVGGEQ